MLLSLVVEKLMRRLGALLVVGGREVAEGKVEEAAVQLPAWRCRPWVGISQCGCVWNAGADRWGGLVTADAGGGVALKAANSVTSMVTAVGKGAGSSREAVQQVCLSVHVLSSEFAIQRTHTLVRCLLVGLH